MRPRKRLNRDLPRNLYLQKKGKAYYYIYRNPQTGKSTSLGGDRNTALLAARQLNEALIPKAAGVDDLVARVIGSTNSAGEWLDQYEIIIADRELADNSRRVIKSQVGIIRDHFSSQKINQITTKDIADFINAYANQGKRRQAQLLRTRLDDIFNTAIQDGIIKVNPVTATRNPKVKVQRARIILDDYLAILEQAADMQPYIANAMQLGLITGQRLTDIAHMKFRDIRDGYLHVTQQKHGAMIRLSLDLQLDELGISLAGVVARCRDRVVSRHLIHHTRNWNGARAGEAVHPDSISDGFRRARKATGLNWEGKPPSFHELRSLAGRLYDKQDDISAQAVLGHKDPATTARYIDARGVEWISVG